LSKKTQYVLDIVVLVLAFAFAYLIRFDFAPPRDDISSALKQLPAVLFLQFAILMGAGVYSFIWRYVGL